MLFILIVIHGVSVPTSAQSFYCLHTGFSLHLELLAEMSLQANGKEADTGELSPSLPQNALAFL